MKLFLSYPSAQRPLAERLALALEAEGHTVFIDRTDLAAGEAFHQPLRDAIAKADAMVFLVTPDAVNPGSYALAELEIARARWRRPSGHVLPVIVQPTPIAALPAYLSAVTLLEPRGDLVGETVAAVARLAARRRRWVWGVFAAAALLVVAAGLGWLQVKTRSEQAAERAALERDLAFARSALETCRGSTQATALAQLSELTARAQPQPEVQDAREDCAMRWLREMRSSGANTFAAQTAVVQPVLLQGLARSQGARAADLRAHLGWAEFLRSKEGLPGDPLPHWQRALQDDPGNVYANAMWANQTLQRRPMEWRDAAPLFERALAGGRERPWVRGLQMAATERESTLPYAVQVLDAMRRGGEALPDDWRPALRSRVFGTPFFDAATRTALLNALPRADLLATFDWIFPPAERPRSERDLLRYVRGVIALGTPERDAARADLQALAYELVQASAPGRLLDETQRALRAPR